MGNKEIEYTDPEPGLGLPRVPLGLRLRALGAGMQESLMHPLTTTIIRVDVENNKVIVQRVRKSPEQK